MTAPICALCGTEISATLCPACGAEVVLDARDQLQDHALSAADQTASDRDQTANDRDQTTSDDDQSASDLDQSASDADQQSSDRDQAAADHDLAAGADRRMHAQTTRARSEATGDRDESTRTRDRAARARLVVASARDVAARERDYSAEERDAVARKRDDAHAGDESHEGILRHAARDRERAASDRERAADDRAQAGADREVAAWDRTESSRVRADSAALIQQAATDQLTGARTRFFGLEEAAREVERANRTHTGLAVAFVDVAGLRTLNETRGRDAGDALLRLVGTTLRENLRAYDIVVRYGGHEFVCTLPNVTASEARVRFQRIAADLTASDAEHSMTFGIAAATTHDSLEGLIARADKDLPAQRTRTQQA